jgi:DNA-binding NarL/FixJ family response regulator
MPVRILVADDYQGVRTAVSQLIQNSREDWKVCWEAEDGQAAIDKAVEEKPDLVILDMRMPRRDGLSAGREIRALLPAVRILIFTLIDSPYLEAEAAACGFQGVVQKSRGASLIPAIRKALAVEVVPSEGCHGGQNAA